MLQLFHFNFFQNAFIISLLISILFGFLSFFIVMRKMTFLGAGIAHTAFGGIALGLYFEINPFLSSLVFCIIIALLIGKLAQFGQISYDTSIGIFFSSTMALGVLLISLKKAYTFYLT